MGLGHEWIGSYWELEQMIVSKLQISKLRPNEIRLENPWGEWPKKPVSFGTWRVEHLSGLGHGHRGIDKMTPACFSQWPQFT